MNGLLQRILPREQGFFDLFAKQAENIHDGAEALVKMLSHYTGVPEQVQSIKAIEHEGDEIAHGLLTKLNQTFITPFDREDIHSSAASLMTSSTSSTPPPAASSFTASTQSARAPSTSSRFSSPPPRK